MTALDKKETSAREAVHKFQGVRDSADAQEPIGEPSQRIASKSSSQDDNDVPTPSSGDSLNSDSEAGVGGEKSVAGRKTMKGGETKDVVSSKKYPKESSKAVGKEKSQDEDETSGQATSVESEEDHEIETELNSILKKGPSQSSPLLLPPDERHRDLN